MDYSGHIYKKGDFIGQKYEIYDILGEGGFGIVYLAYSHDTESIYALKTFRDEYLEDQHTRERFRKEAQVWIDLERHPYLVRAYFVDEVDDRLFIAMEYIAPNEQGLNSLDAYIEHNAHDLAQCLRWAVQFCYGMEYAYSRGILAHRDIKPTNIMVDNNKIVKISDFGLAGVIGLSRTIKDLKFGIQKGKAGFSFQTMEGVGFGTPTHMPPEQFINATECDERSDIYSFGIVLYQLATGGKLPFLANPPKNDSYEESRRVWVEFYKLHCHASIHKIDSPLFSIILKCLEKKPRKRYQSFKDLRADVEVILKKLTGETIKPTPMEELAAWELFNKGISLLLLDKEEEARSCFDKNKAINPIDVAVWNIKGLRLSENGNFQKAIACYDEALEINPRYEVTWFNKGEALYELGKYHEALACYSKAVEIKPIFSWAWHEKGRTLSMIGKHSDAIICYDKALELNPIFENTWLAKSVALGSLGKYQDALTCCSKALEINTVSELALYRKGHILDCLGRYQDAVACLDQLLEINPSTGEATWITKGTALIHLGKCHDAIDCYERAIGINPAEALAWHNKGTALIILNKYKDALYCFSEALRLNPRYADVLNNKKSALTIIIDAFQCSIKSTMDENYIQMASEIIEGLEANL